jgi:hypothetical protein
MIISEDDPISKARAITGNIKLQHFNAMTANKQLDGKAGIKTLKNGCHNPVESKTVLPSLDLSRDIGADRTGN